jgi:hypothetical protein
MVLLRKVCSCAPLLRHLSRISFFFSFYSSFTSYEDIRLRKLTPPHSLCASFPSSSRWRSHVVIRYVPLQPPPGDKDDDCHGDNDDNDDDDNVNGDLVI